MSAAEPNWSIRVLSGCLRGELGVCRACSGGVYGGFYVVFETERYSAQALPMAEDSAARAALRLAAAAAAASEAVVT